MLWLDGQGVANCKKSSTGVAISEIILISVTLMARMILIIMIPVYTGQPFENPTTWGVQPCLCKTSSLHKLTETFVTLHKKHFSDSERSDD